MLIALSPFWPTTDFKTHFKMTRQRPALTKAVRVHPFSSILSKWSLYYHLTLRGHNFTAGDMHSVEAYVKLKLCECTFWWNQ